MIYLALATRPLTILRCIPVSDPVAAWTWTCAHRRYFLRPESTIVIQADTSDLANLTLSGDRVQADIRTVGSVLYRWSPRGPVYLFPLTR